MQNAHTQISRRNTLKTTLALGLAAIGMSVSMGMANAATILTTLPPGEAPIVTNTTVLHQTLKVGDVEVFYREAGNKTAPKIVLLHGFPTSSQMYRNLIPQLAKQ